MHASALLIDEALAIFPEEEKALAEENVDLAFDLAEKRASLLRRAWKERHGLDPHELRSRLLRVKERQDAIYRAANDLKAELRQKQTMSRKQTKYLNGDRQQLALSQRSLYFDKIS